MNTKQRQLIIYLIILIGVFISPFIVESTNKRDVSTDYTQNIFEFEAASDSLNHSFEDIKNGSNLEFVSFNTNFMSVFYYCSGINKI